MKKIVLVLFTALIAAPHVQAQPDSTLVKTCFAGYKNAILSDKGPEAVSFVDSRTLTYYTDILQKVKTLDSVGLDKLPIMDKMTILLLRHRATKEEIMKLDGGSLLAFAIQRGMVGKSSVQTLSIGEVMINGNAAEGQVMVNGQPTPLAYNFYKENGAWKMDITSALPEGNKAMKKVVEESGMPENEFLILVIENVSGTEPAKTIWKPLLN